MQKAAVFVHTWSKLASCLVDSHLSVREVLCSSCQQSHVQQSYSKLWGASYTLTIWKGWGRSWWPAAAYLQITLLAKSISSVQIWTTDLVLQNLDILVVHLFLYNLRSCKDRILGEMRPTYAGLTLAYLGWSNKLQVWDYWFGKSYFKCLLAKSGRSQDPWKRQWFSLLPLFFFLQKVFRLLGPEQLLTALCFTISGQGSWV